MPAGKCRRPTRKRQRGGGDDDKQTRAHRTASGRTSPPLRDFSYSPRRSRRKSPQLSRENCGLTPKNAQLSRENSGILSLGSTPDNETAKAPYVNGRASAPECGPRCAVAGAQRATAPLLPSRNETMGCRRATGSTTKRPSPLESRKGRSGTALRGWQLTLRQRGPGRGQDLRSNSWRFSRRLVSRNS